MNPIALITGATAGIGRATAIKLAENGYDLIITGRRESLLQDLAKLITDQTGKSVKTLCFDIRNQEEVKTELESLGNVLDNIDVLVNNAGLAAGLSPIHEGALDDWEQMIDTNVKGLLYIWDGNAQYGEKEKGHIINISSIAGKEVYPNGNVYCSTKHAVDAITKAMRMDMVKHGVKVTSICPGAVETEFSLVRFKGDAERAKQVYEGFTPLYAEDIAEAVLFAVSRPAHVNINDMLIMCTTQASAMVWDK